MRPRLLSPFLLVLALSCDHWSPTDPSNASLFGVVTNVKNGLTIAGAKVAVADFSGHALGTTSQSDGNGGYSIHELRPGHDQLIVYYGPAGGALYVREPIDIHEGANLHDIALGNPIF
jgi:hypothetical protein